MLFCIVPATNFKIVLYRKRLIKLLTYPVCKSLVALPVEDLILLPWILVILYYYRNESVTGLCLSQFNIEGVWLQKTLKCDGARFTLQFLLSSSPSVSIYVSVFGFRESNEYVNFIVRNLKIQCPNSRPKLRSLTLKIWIVTHKLGWRE